MLVYYLQMLDTPEEKVKFEQIYLKYRGLMYQVADGILHNRQDAEDAVHNAFLRIIKKFSRFQNTPAMGTDGGAAMGVTTTRPDTAKEQALG